jgi:hypothetical protein
MDHAIRLGGAATQALQVFESASMYLGAGGGERLGSRIRPRQSEDLMAGVDEFRNDGRTDKAGRAGSPVRNMRMENLQGCPESNIG